MPEQLTREAILALPAGREMDAEVVKHVFGMRVESRPINRDPETGNWHACIFCEHPEHGLPCPRAFEHQYGPCWRCEWEVDGEKFGSWEVVPAYSTDIAAAWRVVEFESSLRRSLNPVRLSQTLKGWCCRIRTDDYKHVVADGETPTLAICRAALLTII